MERNRASRLGGARSVAMNDISSAWLDTNVIVRYLVADDPLLADKATTIVEQSARLLVNTAVLAESSYVMTSVYGRPRADVIDALSEFVARHNIRIPGVEKAYVLDALRRCRDSGRISIVDALLWAEARSSHSKAIYTFDGRFPGEGVQLLGLD